MTHSKIFNDLEKPHTALTLVLMGDPKRFTPAEWLMIESAEELLNEIRTRLRHTSPQAPCPRCRERLGLPPEEEIAAMSEAEVLRLLVTGNSKPRRQRSR